MCFAFDIKGAMVDFWQWVYSFFGAYFAQKALLEQPIKDLLDHKILTLSYYKKFEKNKQLYSLQKTSHVACLESQNSFGKDGLMNALNHALNHKKLTGG